MRTCQSCGGDYHKVGREDFGLCDPCVTKAAGPLKEIAVDRSSGSEDEKKDHLPAYRRKTAEATEAFYAGRKKSKKKKRKAT